MSHPPTAAAGPQVNLTFTGTNDFAAVGIAGLCLPGKDASGKVTKFGFEAPRTTIHGLGTSFSLAELSAGYVDVKWVLANGTDAYARPGPAQGGTDADVVVSPDKHTVTLDVELSQLHAAGDPGPRPEHVSGTVYCP